MLLAFYFRVEIAGIDFKRHCVIYGWQMDLALEGEYSDVKNKCCTEERKESLEQM